MKNMIELTDLMDGDNESHATVPVNRVAATIREWYPANESDIRPSDLDKVDEFQAALIAEDYEQASELAGELAVGFDHVQVD